VTPRSLRRLDACTAGRFELLDRRRIDIDAFDLMAGLEQILRHRQSHIAEADKSDARHGALPFTADVLARTSTRAKDKELAGRPPGHR
jgi:hypothetical protein